MKVPKPIFLKLIVAAILFATVSSAFAFITVDKSFGEEIVDEGLVLEKKHTPDPHTVLFYYGGTLGEATVPPKTFEQLRQGDYYTITVRKGYITGSYYF